MSFYAYNPIAADKPDVGRCVRLDIGGSEYIEVTECGNGVEVRIGTERVIKVLPICANVVRILPEPERNES